MTLIFLFPLVYRPSQDIFRRRFEFLSQNSNGYIFTVSSKPHNDFVIGHYHLYSRRSSPYKFCQLIRGFIVQTILPIRLLKNMKKIDTIIAYDPYASGIAGLIIKIILRARFIVEINGEYHSWKNSETFLKRMIKNYVFHLSVTFADALKVLNTEQEIFIKKKYPLKKLYRFPSYIDISYFNSLQCYQGDYFLSIGYPYHRKGMDLLIKAFQLISDRHVGMKLRIMGYCPNNELSLYKKLAENNPCIEFLGAGWMSDVGEQIRGCFAFVSAARSEAMGRVIFEAMASGKPVIASKTSGAMDYIEDGKTGLLFELNSYEDLAQKMDKLLTTPRLREQLCVDGIRMTQREFSEQVYSSRFLNMIQEVNA